LDVSKKQKTLTLSDILAEVVYKPQKKGIVSLSLGTTTFSSLFATRHEMQIFFLISYTGICTYKCYLENVRKPSFVFTIQDLEAIIIDTTSCSLMYKT
jgi:hypothetical protein